MFENVWVPIRSWVLTDTHQEVSGSFTDVTGVTACTQKFVNDAWTKPTRTSRKGNLWSDSFSRAHFLLELWSKMHKGHDPGFISPTISVYRKKTFTGLLLSFFCFTSSSYKLGLIKTLIDRTYKINNTWKAFVWLTNRFRRLRWKGFKRLARSNKPPNWI